MQYFTFPVFFEQFINKKTMFGIRKSLNLLFYGISGKTNGYHCPISQSTASKIKKEGIPPHSALFEYYLEISNDLKFQADNIRKLSLSGIPITGKELLLQLDNYYIPGDLIADISSEEDVYISLAKVLRYSIMKLFMNI